MMQSSSLSRMSPSCRYVLGVLICGAVGISFANPASAFQVKKTKDGAPVFWDDPRVTYFINEAGSDDLGPGRSKDEVVRSFEAWNNHPGSALELVFGGTTGEADYGYVPGEENINLVTWEEEEWEFDRTALMVTLTTFSTRTGKLLDADIVVNGASYTWGDGSDPRIHDTANSMTHEVGHLVGLDHSKDREATMFASAPPGETKKRDLSEDDIKGMLVLYGDGSAPGFEFPDAEDAIPSVATEDSGVRINDAAVHLKCSAATPSGSGSGGYWGILGLMALGLIAVFRRSKNEDEEEEKSTTTQNAVFGVTLLIVAGLLTVPGRSEATVLPELSVESLVEYSDRVVIAEVVGQEARFERGMIWTRTTVRVEECLEGVGGPCTEGEEIVVKAPGGTVGEIVQTISGIQPMEDGSRVVLFLGKKARGVEVTYSMVGMAQGMMNLEDFGGKILAIRDLEGLLLQRPDRSTVHGGDRNLAIPLGELRQMVRGVQR